MQKNYQITDFVSFVGQNNGKYRIVCSIGQEGNIYRWLKTKGFGRAMINGKTVTFCRTGEAIKPAKFWQMNDVFHEYLETVSYNQMPEDMNRRDLLEWYLTKSPLKQNNLYRHCLQSTLSEEETHGYKMISDSLYRHRYEIDLVKNMLSLNGFKQTEDIAGTVSKGVVLYYRQLQGNRFLLLSHHNAEHKNPFVDGFDCWLGSFRNERQIGRVQTKSLKDIRFSFQYDRDYALIAPYLNN